MEQKRKKRKNKRKIMEDVWEIGQSVRPVRAFRKIFYFLADQGSNSPMRKSLFSFLHKL